MRVGQARKRDANEAEIVQALEAIGCIVLRLSGDGVPDLLTFRAGQWLPIEIKSPGGALTASQRHLKAIADFPVVESVEEALALFGRLEMTSPRTQALRYLNTYFTPWTFEVEERCTLALIELLS